jgi:ligand-binding sensor domain-containing protein/DNA-binding CsgD family transcriptional regulator
LSQGQNTIGIPDIINYTKEKYGGGTQNRGVAQDRNGILYFANYEGLMSFDGTYWKLYPLPNRTVVRSVAIGEDNRIYAGGQNDFGYFSPDKSGRLTYTSLKPLLPAKHHSFSDVWTIIPFKGDVYFRSEERIFQLSHDNITVYPATGKWQFLGRSGDQLLAQDTKNGLLTLLKNVWTPFVKHAELPPTSLLSCCFAIGKDSTFLTTITDGFYILSGDRISRFKFKGHNPFSNQRILTAVPVTKDRIAVGTNLNGCYIIDKNGETVQNLSRKEGLQINNIISLFVDSNGNLWLGLDNGIDFIAYNNAITHIYPEALNEGEGYASIIYRNELYVGTSNGVYKVPLTDKEDLGYVNGEFRSVRNTKGSSWNLSEVNGRLLLGHHDGAFLINGETAVPLNKNGAFWRFLPLSNVLPASYAIAGNTGGLDLLRFEHGGFTSIGNLPLFNVASQFLELDNNNTVWVAHPYRGVYKLDISDLSRPVVKPYDEKNGLPSTLKIHLFKIKNRIAITTEKGVYEYNNSKDVFELSDYFAKFFGIRNIRHLQEDPAGNIWFVEGKNLGVVDLSGEKSETIYFQELDGKMVSGNEHIYPYNRFNVFVGAEKGIYHINYDEYKRNHYALQVGIRSVKAFGKTDSLLYGGYSQNINEKKVQAASEIPAIAHQWNSFRFEYSSPLYEQLNNVVYSYYLEQFDKGWSAWSKKPEKEYTNLPAGRYTFKVKTKNNLGKESPVSSYSFEVLPPWYLSRWAYSLYFVLLATVIYLAYLLQHRKFLRQQLRHEEEQKRMQYLHQLELDKSEKEIIALRNERLQAQIQHKNSELASVAMHLVQRGELLTKIKDELTRIKNGNMTANGNHNGHNSGNGNLPTDPAGNADFKKIIRILKEEEKLDKDWEHFAVHFDTVHSDFLKDLKEHYENLSSNELKLCAYLRMNLSSKEIAQLMNISVRGVEISRYRLRKKLSIPTEINLFDFLMKFNSHKSA